MKLSPYHLFKHPKQMKSAVDKLALVLGIAVPFATLPQILKIYGDKDATNIAVFTWVCYGLVALIFFFYARYHKLIALMISNFLWVMADVTVVIGWILYS